MFSKPIMLIAVAVVVLGGGYLLFSSRSSTDSVQSGNAVATGTAAATETLQQEPGGRKMAFGDLVKQKGTYKCTVSQYAGNIESKGTVYINGDNLRGEFFTKVQNMNIDTTMVVRDGFTYTWTSMAPTMGFKAPVAKGESTGSAQASGTYSWNSEQIGDYNCEAWTADSSKFEIPANIKFTEAK